MRYFNEHSLEALPRAVQKAPAGFRFGHISNIFQDSVYRELIQKFPPLEKFRLHEDEYKRTYEGVFYDSHQHHGCADHLSYVDPLWLDVIQEATSREFIQLLSNGTGISFNSLRSFGFNIGKKGNGFKQPHLDNSATSGHPGRSRIVCMIYLGEKSGIEEAGGTCIYGTDRKTLLFQPKNLYNSMLFFEQHKDVWHGYPILTEDNERKTLQLTFNSEDSPIYLKRSFFHKVFCRTYLFGASSKSQNATY